MFELWYFAFWLIKTHKISIDALKNIQNNAQGPLELETGKFTNL